MHKIWTMDPKVRAAIHQLQPYYTGHDDLLILNELARVDRHQSLRLMGGHNPSVTQGWRKKGTRDPFVADFSRFSGVSGTVSEVTMGPFEHDAVIGHFRFNEPEMEVNFQTSIYVAFRDEGPAKGRHALRTLINVRRHIEEVIVPKLKRFF